MPIARGLAKVGVAAVLLVGSIAAGAPAGASSGHARVLLDDLSSPKGVAVTPWGDVIVAQGAFGAPGPVLVVPQRGPDRGTALPVTDPFPLVDVAVSPLDGTGWGIGFGEDGHGYLFHELADGTIEVVLDITLYQQSDPDPVDQEGFPEDSNPYGMTVMANGDVLIADAAGNDIIRVTPEGDATTVARLDVQLVSTDHIGSPELPPALLAEAVPTTVTVGPDGYIYVGELKGFPFRPETSNIWRIDPDAEDAWCSVTDPSADCTLHLDGFTAIQDIAVSHHSGRLYVYELAADGVLAFEEGFAAGAFPAAVLLEVHPNGSWKELAAGELSEPGGVAVGHDNKVYVTDHVFTGGRLLRIT